MSIATCEQNRAPEYIRRIYPAQTIEETMEVMKFAREKLQKSIRVEAELRATIETQRAVIIVALGYLQSGLVPLAVATLVGQTQQQQENPAAIEKEVAP